MNRYVVAGNTIIAENLSETKQIAIEMKEWTNTEGTMTRYYVKRDGYPIGWIGGDLKTGKGQSSSTNQTYVDRMIRALAGEEVSI